MERRQRAEGQGGRQVVGGPERFDAFFDREAPGVLALALLVASDRTTAESATRRAFVRARREWDSVGLDSDPAAEVRRWAVDGAWPSRRVRSRVVRQEVEDEIDRLRRALLVLPKRRGRALAVGLGGDRSSAAVAAAGGREAFDRLIAVVGPWLAAVAADPEVVVEHLRPAPSETAPGSRRLTPVAVVAAAAVVVLAVLRVDSSVDRDVATATSTRASTTTLPRVVTAESPWWWNEDWTGAPPEVTLVGWETVAPVVGEAMAAAWTGRELFVLTVVQPSMVLELDERAGASFFDPEARSWRPVAPVPEGVCPFFWAQVMPVADGVFLKGFGRDCSPAIFYSPASDAWSELHTPFLTAPFGSSLVWTGELLVSPVQARALDWASGSVINLPVLPFAGLIQPGSGGLQAHWTGERVLAIGGNGLHAWTPGDDAWQTLDATQHLSETMTAWTSEGLLVLDRDEGARFHDGDGWRSAPGLFWDGSCWPDVVQVDVPVVRVCNGYFVWDGAADRWIPFPVASVDYDHHLVRMGGDLYSLGRSLRRLVVDRDADGRALPASTVPVGTLYLDLPEWWEYVEHFGPARRPLGYQSGLTWASGVVVEHVAGDARCMVEVTSWHSGRSETWPDGFVPGRALVVPRPGIGDLTGSAVSSDGGAVGIALPDGMGVGPPSSILVSCEGPDETGNYGSAMLLAAGLWSLEEGRYSFAQVSADGEGFLWEVQALDGVQAVQFPYRTVPDRTQSKLARDRFVQCVAENVGDPGVVLAGLSLLVDTDDELLELVYRALRPQAWPPVTRVADETRLHCLQEAGVDGVPER